MALKTSRSSVGPTTKRRASQHGVPSALVVSSSGMSSRRALGLPSAPEGMATWWLPIAVYVSSLSLFVSGVGFIISKGCDRVLCSLAKRSIIGLMIVFELSAHHVAAFGSGECIARRHGIEHAAMVTSRAGSSGGGGGARRRRRGSGGGGDGGGGAGGGGGSGGTGGRGSRGGGRGGAAAADWAPATVATAAATAAAATVGAAATSTRASSLVASESANTSGAPAGEQRPRRNGCGAAGQWCLSNFDGGGGSGGGDGVDLHCIVAGGIESANTSGAPAVGNGDGGGAAATARRAQATVSEQLRHCQVCASCSAWWHFWTRASLQLFRRRGPFFQLRAAPSWLSPLQLLRRRGHFFQLRAAPS